MMGDRSPLVLFLLALSLCVWRSTDRAALGAAPAAVDELGKLAAAGQHAEVVARADALLSAGPNWRLSFNGQAVDEAFIGADYGYFRLLTGHPAPPVLPAAKHRPHNAGRFDWLHYVTCVDLRTGKPVWTRAFVPHPRMGIDPRDDALWVWHEKEGWFEQIDAATADTRRRGEVPKAAVTPGELECLRDNGTDIWARTTRNTTNPTAGSRLDLETKQVQENVARPFALSPGGLRRLSYSTLEWSTTVACTPPGGGQPIWSFQVPDTTYNPPTWFGRDAIVLAGGPYVPGVLYRLDGDTGAVRWRTAVGAYGYSPTLRQLRGGTYATGGWTTVGSVGDEVWTIDLSNRLRFFDADSGTATRRRPLGGGGPIAPPRFSPDGHALVVATTGGMKRVPLDEAADPTAPVLAMKARSLVALQRRGEAIAVASAAALDTDAPAAWDALADALADAGHPDRATAARAQALIASGAAESDALRRSHGLLWRHDTGPVMVAPVVLEDTVLVGEVDGTVRTIDPVGCREIGRELVEGGISTWALRADRLVSRGGDNMEDVVRVFARAPAVEPGDPVSADQRPELIRVVRHGETMAFLNRGARGAVTLEIRARGGEGKVIRSAKVHALAHSEREPGRLLRLRDGYLVSAGELLYLPDDPAKFEWRFGLLWDDVPHRDWTDVQAASFGVPRVVGDRLIVAGYQGGFYVFDVNAICGP